MHITDLRSAVVQDGEFRIKAINMYGGLIEARVSLAETWRRRGKFEDVKFIFPNAPTIPITVVRA
jgi:hypothetical protein